MPKLHELLAVEGPRKAQAAKVRTELAATFDGKPHHFTEKKVTYKPREEASDVVVEDQLDLQTTVPRELEWIAPFLITSLDASYQVAEANTVARADIVLDDGTVLAAGLPATSLLELEKRTAELREFVTKIKTLDPAKGFSPDPERGAGIFRARDERKTRTQKISRPMILHPGNDKIAAQVQLVTEDVPVGDKVTMEWSGLITTADKGKMLERVEDLARAVKSARSRANDTEVPRNDRKIGAKIIGFVFGQDV